MISLRLDAKTKAALEKRAAELGTSQSNAIGVALGTMPESAFVATDKRGKLIVR